MAEQDQNRNEAATPHKKEEARKKGSVAKSMDVNSFVILAVFLITLYVWGGQIIHGQMLLARKVLSSAHDMTFDTNELSIYLAQTFAEAIILLAPLFIMLMVFGVLANFFQIGPIFSFFPLKPDLNKINPVAGFKRLFSTRLLIEAVKTVLKFILFGFVLYKFIAGEVLHLLISYNVMPSSLGLLLMPELQSMLFKLLLGLAAVALIDLIYTRWEYAKRLRMSRRDITDEHKRREGDPRVKARIKDLQREALKRAKSLGNVKDADVLITNPTHYAVAIRYNKDTMESPQVVAKGAGFLASRMKSIARKHKVPIVENKLLARTLFRDVGLEHNIPVEHYAVVAKVLYWAYSLKGITVFQKS
ncbi:MAG: flagellar biosynthesis protein FlhB [Methylotenera sp.]